MIGKITAGSAPGGVIEYVLGPGERGVEDRARVLSSTWTGPAAGWASQVHEHQQAERPGFGSSGAAGVIHVSLNAAPGEKLSDDQWRAVASEYLARMGWGEHDHAVVQHTDTPHDHVHLIVDRVGRDGQIADLHRDFERQERALDSIERDFGLERTHEQLRIAAEKDPFRAVESATRSNLTFDRERVERYFDRMGFDPEKVRELTDRGMSDSRVLQAGDRFTTREARAEVLRLDSALRTLAGQEQRPLLDRGAAAREGLDAGQRFAADQIASGKGLTVIEGFAGAGKSTMLRTAAEDLRFSGHDVLGVAPSGKAAKGLQDSAGIASNTLTKTLMELDKGDTKLTRDSVVIVDEAGMARNDELGKLAQHVADAGGRLVLVGDERQLGAVGRGGGFGQAREIAQAERGTARLDEIHRQKEGWQRDASKAFGEGRAKEAIQAYLDHGRVEWAASRGTARDMLVADYVRELERGTSPKDMLALAHENRDVRAMNSAIRDAIKERGGLAGERTYKLEGQDGKTQKIGLAPGDRVVFERNNARAGEKNGEFGTVVKTDARGFDVRMDDGRMQRVEDGGKHQMSHGYASTIHKSQGSSIEKILLLASRGMDAALTYVGLSRQKDDARLYANRAEHKDGEHLKNSLSRDGGKESFKSVLGAGQERGQGKESAQTRAQDRDHGPAQPAGERQERASSTRAAQDREVEKSGIGESRYGAGALAAAAYDQRKFDSGLSEKERDHAPQAGQDRQAGRAEGKGQERQAEARDRERQDHDAKDGRGAAATGEGKEVKAEGQQREKDRSQEKAGQQALAGVLAGQDRGHEGKAGKERGGEKGQGRAQQRQAGQEKGQERQPAQKSQDHGPRGAAGEQRGQQAQGRAQGQDRGGEGKEREQGQQAQGAGAQSAGQAQKSQDHGPRGAAGEQRGQQAQGRAQGQDRGGEGKEREQGQQAQGRAQGQDRGGEREAEGAGKISGKDRSQEKAQQAGGKAGEDRQAEGKAQDRGAEKDHGRQTGQERQAGGREKSQAKNAGAQTREGKAAGDRRGGRLDGKEKAAQKSSGKTEKSKGYGL